MKEWYEMKIQKKKLSEILAPMSTKEKVSYLWHYYRLHAIGTIVAIFIIVSLVSTGMGKKDIVLNVVLMGAMVNTDNLALLDDQVTPQILSEEEMESFDISFRHISHNSESMTSETAMGLQKMAAEISSKSIDVFIVNKDLFTQMSNDGQLLPLEELEGFDKNAFEEDQLLISSEGKIDGISTSKLKMFEDIIYNEELIISIPMNFQNTEETSEFFQLLN